MPLCHSFVSKLDNDVLDAHTLEDVHARPAHKTGVQADVLSAGDEGREHLTH